MGHLIVIGSGIGGLSAAWAAGLMGFAVTCVEARTIGNAAASSAGPGKIFRYAYEDVHHAKHLAEIEPLWHDLERRAGSTLIEPCPGLNIGRTRSTAITLMIDSLEVVGRPYEVLQPGDRQLSAFGLRLHDGETAVLEPGAGVMIPGVVFSALVNQVVELGVTLLERTTVTGLTTSPYGIRLDTDAGPLTADRVVVAAGPWVADLLPAPPAPLTVTRQHQLTVTTSRPIGTGARFSWADVTRDEGYGIANHGGIHVVGSHAHGPVGRHLDDEPDERGIRATHTSLSRFADRIIGHPDVTAAHSRLCHYTNTADGRFLVAPLDEVPGAVVLSACSGHGFKFALGTGRQAVEMALQA